MEQIINLEFPSMALILPELIVLTTAFLLFSLDILYKRLNHTLAVSVSVIGYLLALLYIVLNFNLYGETFYGLYVRDSFSSLLQSVMILLSIAVLAFTYTYYRYRNSLYGEFYYILSFVLAGALFLVSSYNLVVIYITLEAVSISFYILTALYRKDFNSKEGSFKYLILGGLSIALSSYGAAFMYLYSGSLDLRDILTHSANDEKLLIIGLALFLVGFAIKIGAVPFHFWLPDAYQGAPTPITAYMASVGKVAFFAPLARIMPLVSEHFESAWVLTISVISALTMLYGNLVALSQKDVKRLLAYSSIAHSGYVLAGMAVAHVIGLKAVLYFLIAYSIMGMGSFVTLGVLERNKDWENKIDNFAGLRFSKFYLAVAFAVFMFSLLGVPPTVGFVAKALVFMALAYKELWFLAFVMVVATGISTGYYLRLVAVMFMRKQEQDVYVNLSRGERLVLSVLSVAALLLGMLPMVIWSFVDISAEFLFRR